MGHKGRRRAHTILDAEQEQGKKKKKKEVKRKSAASLSLSTTLKILRRTLKKKNQSQLAQGVD